MGKTALYENHVRAGGKIVDFHGWELPIQYGTGIIAEHNAVRNAAGIFDVSHMGEVIVEGKDAAAYLEHILTNTLGKLGSGGLLYSPMCYEDGGTVDDLIVYKVRDDKYFIVVNASNTQKDHEWMLENAGSFKGVSVKNVSPDYAQLAVQGPKAEQILSKLTKSDLSQLRFFHFLEKASIGGFEGIVSRSGYTGEDGFEIYLDPSNAPALWDKILDAGREEGIIPAGLGARDTLRQEACLPLYGQELEKDITPVEAGLSRFISFEKSSFNGKAKLQNQHDNVSGRRLAGYEMIDRGIPRHGFEILSGGKSAGITTSGTFSPTLDKNVGMALLEPSLTTSGTEIEVLIRNRPLRARIVPMPFYKKKYKTAK